MALNTSDKVACKIIELRHNREIISKKWKGGGVVLPNLLGEDGRKLSDPCTNSVQFLKLHFWFKITFTNST